MSDLPAPIPDHAQEEVIDSWESGAKRSVYYLVNGERVGYRHWSETGQLGMEYSILDGSMHGPFRTWHDNGQLCEVAWYEHGKEHGTTVQYDHDGNLIGSYTMTHGTGVDLWFARPGVISEERHYQDGKLHGFERWWNEDNQTVYQESHFWHGVEHGIFRQWNQAGRLRRGYPRYYVEGKQVRKAQYERACRRDLALPPFRLEENMPQRQAPNLPQSE